MLDTIKIVIIAALLVLRPIAAEAQAPPAWDVAATAGLFSAHTEPLNPPRYSDDWLETYQVGAAVGRHLNRHLKIELEASMTGTGSQFVEHVITVPGMRFPYALSAEAETTTRTVGAWVAWQFRENEWVHPFVRGGVSADFERKRLRVWDPYFSRIDTGVSPPPVLSGETFTDPETSLRARLSMGGGAKIYVSPRAFLRPEGLLSLGHQQQNFAVRLGFGVDF